jgi:hypothetical protein
MKHIKQISKRVPARANTWQDFLCALAGVAASLLTVKGGSLPFVSYIDEKCQPSTDLEM